MNVVGTGAAFLGLGLVIAAQFIGWSMGFKAVFVTCLWTFNIANLFHKRDVGAVLLCVGGLANTAAVIANGGYMPAATATERRSWWTPIDEHTRLRPLCDIIFGVFSVGDVFILASALTSVTRRVFAWVVAP